MRMVRVLLGFLLVVAQLSGTVPQAAALSQTGVVIGQLYPGSTGVATQEFVELYNTATVDVDVTNWCLSYISATGVTTSKLGCLTPPNTSTAIWVKAGGYITFVSNEYRAAFSSTVADGYFAGGMAATGGHVKLADAAGNEVDRLGWGTAVNPETAVAAVPANTKSLQRTVVAGTMQDTNNNAVDFVAATPTLHASGTYEVVTIIDVCPNMLGAQTTIPSGYALDERGNCQPDNCTNLSGLQVGVPDGYDSDGMGGCVQHDECPNVNGIQAVVPNTMIHDADNDCVWDVQPLELTEILPNAVGADTGNEFIEIYNPTDRVIDLSLYSVRVGVAGDKEYAFPTGATIMPGEYRAFSDSAMKFTLVNTTSRVVLRAIDGTTLGDTGEYSSPAEGESWALLNETWQYTNQATPGAENKASIFAGDAVELIDTNTEAPCPAGKYRNPLTNRCRTIVADASVLATCDADQYRNPDTGRCKKISFATATPCKDNQYRSEETNRCRTIAAAATQKPCKENQYRSEETNRCRNLPATSVPAAAFAVQPVKDTGTAFVGWWALGGVGLLAVGYAVWEWRVEIMNALRSASNRRR